VRLSQNNLLRLTLPVPESAVPTVHIGQQVDVKVPSLNRSLPGRVARFADKINEATRTMDTQVDVPNADLVLVPGMYAEVHLMLDRRAGVLAVPVDAVDVDGDGSGSSAQVTVITSANTVEKRKVQLGLSTANLVEVRSGLKAGDLVAVANRASLLPGQHVRPKLTAAAAAGSE